MIFGFFGLGFTISAADLRWLRPFDLESVQRALAVNRRRYRAEAPRDVALHGARAARGVRSTVRSRQSYARVRCDRRRAAWRAERSGR